MRHDYQGLPQRPLAKARLVYGLIFIPLIFLPLFALIFLALPQPLSGYENPLRVGFGGALLGNLSNYGLSNFYGVEYAIRNVNAKGGVLGRHVDLISEDDSCNPAQATTAANKLLNSGVSLIFGHTCSGATRRALSVYKNKALVISSSATETSLTDKGLFPYFFRTTPRDDAQVKLLIALIKKNGYKKVAILHDKSDYGQSLAEMAQKSLRERPDEVEVVLFEAVSSGQASFEAVLSRIKTSQAEALLWGGYYNDAGKLATQLRQRLPQVVLLGPEALFDPRFLMIAQEAADGTYCAGQENLALSPAARAAVADHRRKHYSKEIGIYFFYAAGAAQALFAAVNKVGSDQDLAAIKKRLQEDTVETIMGPVRFNAKGDIIGAKFKLYVIKYGKYQEVNL
ncbi:MAG: branched-chain amino acid ABC transporter substrate-binding protein [Deltaproteobacteria bacterium]|jgi:branched-chain amino acid transport system substrate-binding protein|nr:branched-chain amino acid ABC transporter substrate-binding protein [Deltaproteobacteria bacterium]